MSDESTRRTLLRASAVIVFVFAACSGSGSGCGGSGCGGCNDGTYRYPKNDPNRPDAVLQTEAARIRITQSFIDFIKPTLPALIKGALGSQAGFRVDANDVLHVPIPNTDLFNIGVASAKLRDGEALIWLNDLNDRLDLRFEPPNQLRMTMRNLRLGIMLDLREDVAGTTSSCPIEGVIGPGPIRHAAEISINAVIDPGVGPEPDRLLDIQVQVDDIALNDLRIRVASNYCSEPECRDCLLEVGGTCLDPGGRCAECEIFCGGITDGLLSLVTSLVDLVRPLLNRLLKPIVQNFIRSALADFSNQAAALEMQVNLADIAGIAALKNAKPFGLFVGPDPGRFPVIDRGRGNGMEVTASGGAESALADCVGALPDFNMPKGPVPVLGGTDSRGRPYHVGMTIASTLMNQMLYAVHRSGTLCLKLSSEDIKGLTGGAFSLNSSVLSLLASDLSVLAKDAAPVILQLKPRNAPLLDLGSGDVIGMDAMGNPVRDWLIKLNVEDMGIAFHALIKDRYVRIFEVSMDINVGLGIMVLPNHSLEVAVGELRIDDFTETFNEILPNADFAMVLPTLIDLALKALISNQLVFNLDLTRAVSDALGGAPIFMRINDIFRDGIQEDYLTLTMTFTSSTSTTSLSYAAETYARLADRPDLHVETGVGAHEATGRVRLAVGELLDYTTQRALEYQVRIDEGLWRVPMAAQPDGTLQLADTRLLIPGRHLIDVRARYAEDYQTLDATPARIELLVDPNPPSLSARVVESQVLVRVHDGESKATTLALEGRLDGGAWFAIPLEAVSDEEALGNLPLAQVGSATSLELRAVDSLGNLSQTTRVRVGLNPELLPQDTLQACACHDVPGVAHGHYDGLLLVLLVVGLFALRFALRR